MLRSGQQAVRRPLQQDPPAEPARWLAGHLADDPVEVEPGEVQATGDLLRARFVLVQGIGQHVDEGGEGVGRHDFRGHVSDRAPSAVGRT